jgi:hypothetical protein
VGWHRPQNTGRLCDHQFFSNEGICFKSVSSPSVPSSSRPRPVQMPQRLSFSASLLTPTSLSLAHDLMRSFMNSATATRGASWNGAHGGGGWARGKRGEAHVQGPRHAHARAHSPWLFRMADSALRTPAAWIAFPSFSSRALISSSHHRHAPRDHSSLRDISPAT